MMERWKSLQFNEEDNEVIEIGQLDADGVPNRFKLCLVGSLWT